MKVHPGQWRHGVDLWRVYLWHQHAWQVQEIIRLSVQIRYVLTIQIIQYCHVKLFNRVNGKEK